MPLDPLLVPTLTSAAPSPGAFPQSAGAFGAGVLDELSGHPRGDDLARLVHGLAFSAFDERRPSLADGLSEAAGRAGISHADAETGFGNVLRALERGGSEAAGAATRALLGALLARGVALSPPLGSEADERVAEALVWLATHTHVDALPLLDEALGDAAGQLWAAVGRLVRRVDEGQAPLVGRAGALIAAAALLSSPSQAAREQAAVVAHESRDPIIRSILKPSAAGESGSATLVGELVPPPRGALSTALLAVTGLLLVTRGARLVASVVLRYRRPAEMHASPRGIRVVARTELLGRTLREREIHIPVQALARATREVRYPRLGMYAGLVALALGSYFGASIFLDGARAGSPELLGVGALIAAAGIALDFVLTALSSSMRGRCRVVLVPRKGPALALARVEPSLAEAALKKLAAA